MTDTANTAATDTPQQKAAAKRDRRASQVTARQAPKQEPVAQQAVSPNALAELQAQLAAQAELLEQLRRASPERSTPIGAATLRDRERQYRDMRPVAREVVRPMAREVVRPVAVVAIGRDGQPITRRSSDATDPFSLPDDLREKDWHRQWIRVSVHGQEDISNQVKMQEAGWRPIPAEREGWRGRFMPDGYKGPIVKDGLMLVERPMILTEEAKAENDKVYREQKSR